jgi:hypothetical protein
MFEINLTGMDWIGKIGKLIQWTVKDGKKYI